MLSNSDNDLIVNCLAWLVSEDYLKTSIPVCRIFNDLSKDRIQNVLFPFELDNNSFTEDEGFLFEKRSSLAEVQYTKTPK